MAGRLGPLELFRGSVLRTRCPQAPALSADLVRPGSIGSTDLPAAVNPICTVSPLCPTCTHIHLSAQRLGMLQPAAVPHGFRAHLSPLVLRRLLVNKGEWRRIQRPASHVAGARSAATERRPATGATRDLPNVRTGFGHASGRAASTAQLPSKPLPDGRMRSEAKACRISRLCRLLRR